jgi:lambda family phage portal protein
MSRTVKVGRREVSVPWSLFDRAVEWFSPAAGLSRLRGRVMMEAAGGYNGGRRDRRSLRNFKPKQTSANEDISPDLPNLRARSRDLIRNTPIATGAISTVVTSVVGDGLVLKSQVDRDVLGFNQDQAEAWQAAAEREFAIWACRPDFSSRLNWEEMQDLVLRSQLETGDIFIARRRRVDLGDTYGLKLQLIEGDRVSNPHFRANSRDMVDGVEMDSDGRPTAFHISTRNPDDTMPAARDWRRYEIFSNTSGSPLILHLYKMLRPDQARGVPYLAPVIEAIKQLGDYSDSEARAALVSSMFTVFITSESGEDDSGNPIIGAAGEGTSADAQTEMELGTGAILELKPDEKPEFANPSRPNTAFDGFVKSVCRQIGVALELPAELLLKSFESSYSASRAALETAWQMFRSRRSWLAWKFCQPVYEWVITEAVAKGRLQAPGFFEDAIVREAYLGSEWIGPARIQLDPQKEASADLIDVGMGAKTIEQVCLERTGGTFDRKHAQRAREERLRREAGLITPQSKSEALQPPPQKPNGEDDGASEEETEDENEEEGA